MSIEEAYDAVVAKAQEVEPGTKELPSVVCGVTADGVECRATIRVPGGIRLSNDQPLPVAPSWEGALNILLIALEGDERTMDTAQERLRLLRVKAKAEAEVTEAQTMLDRLPVAVEVTR